MSGAEDLESDLPERRDPTDATVRVLTIVNKKGLHARASAKFCQTVERFDAAIRVTRGSETVGGTSIMGLMMLGAATGTRQRGDSGHRGHRQAGFERVRGRGLRAFRGHFSHIKNSLYPHCTGSMPLL